MFQIPVDAHSNVVFNLGQEFDYCLVGRPNFNFFSFWNYTSKYMLRTRYT